MHKDRSKGAMESHLKAIGPAANLAWEPRPGLQLRLHCQAAPLTTQASPAKKTINLSPKPVHPTAAPVLLQHQACCSTRPLRVKSKSYWSTSPAAVRSQSCCSTSPAAAPGLPHSGSSRPLAWVPSRERPGASCGHPGAGSRHQAAGTRQQAGGREVEENAKAKLKAIFHTSRCENHCTVLLFC